MKKIIVIFLICFIQLGCFANEQPNVGDKTETKEINLDAGIAPKGYNLKHTDYRNNPKIDNNEDNDDMPFNFMSAPLQLLKQYTNGEY